MVTTTRPRRTAALYGAVPLALLLAGCGGGDDSAKPSAAPPVASTPAPATSSADPQTAEKTAVLAAFDAMWTERTKAYAKADAKGTRLEKYATLDALGRVRNDLARMKAAGTVVRGESRQENATVTALDLTSKTPKATITTCVDLSSYEQYSTQKKAVIPLPTNQPLRYAAGATLEKWPNGWMVTTYTPEGGRPC
ncbi:hypothetical protein OH736_45940 (plasmid) [Streptomyces sp. NBC_01650]|uniref:hypothetical protein n=1 Tax=Streptomyces sp. NBC_01650 TaxID=2975907 RepID=UPI002F939D81|nr:hypothetical protein OH736_45940 [Streptomyces sp. NBC_01650]